MIRLRNITRRVDRPHSIDLAVAARLDQLGPMRAGLRLALDDLDVRGPTRSDCVLAVNEVVTSIIESQPDSTVGQIELTVRRRGDELEVLTVSRHVDGSRVPTEAIRERVLDRLTDYSHHRIGIDEDEVLCCFDVR
jgi:hypothetical protein